EWSSTVDEGTGALVSETRSKARRGVGPLAAARRAEDHSSRKPPAAVISSASGSASSEVEEERASDGADIRMHTSEDSIIPPKVEDDADGESQEGSSILTSCTASNDEGGTPSTSSESRGATSTTSGAEIVSFSVEDIEGVDVWELTRDSPVFSPVDGLCIGVLGRKSRVSILSSRAHGALDAAVPDREEKVKIRVLTALQPVQEGSLLSSPKSSATAECLNWSRDPQSTVRGREQVGIPASRSSKTPLLEGGGGTLSPAATPFVPQSTRGSYHPHTVSRHQSAIDNTNTSSYISSMQLHLQGHTPI
ncbi:unnamed protein product, partial [Amoebophrya sp. A25]